MKVKLHRSISDDLLIKACKEGNIDAQKSLFDRYAPKMLTVCKRYLKDIDLAEDIMITGFAKVFEKLEQFRDEGSFEGWIRRLMVNEALTQLRKTKNMQMKVSINDETIQIEDSSLGDHLEASDLMDLIDSLPDGYRAVFNMYAIEGFSHREIALQLGINENTSKSQLSRAREYLKRRIIRLQPIKVIKENHE